MSNSKSGKIIGIITAVCATLLGVTLTVCCTHLYFNGGDTPYSRERVGEYLAYLIIPAIITLAAAAVGIIYNIINRADTDTKINNGAYYRLIGAARRSDVDSLDPEKKAEVLSERAYRKKVKYVFLSLAAVFLAASLAYVIFFGKFTLENLNSDVIRACAVSLPIALIGLSMGIIASVLCERSAERELTALRGCKRITKAEKADGEKKLQPALALRIVLGCAAITLIILGILNGGMADVLGKAVKICTECIGLG